jgi:hypothetical protein
MKTKDLSIKELAAYLGVSTDTIRQRLARGRAFHATGAAASGVAGAERSGVN